ncbi:hypothetical protein BZM27_49785 [Paraburkholderia steynii]|uniref:Uncharacterized protein n=1 Tax=Paraburkholderia steynii TaxID=1245441 RepID=A0A4R0X3I8_9BURK|nr:hypothetical protein BZM27_49785 [Paraburkholderia steynii]
MRYANASTKSNRAASRPRWSSQPAIKQEKVSDASRIQPRHNGLEAVASLTVGELMTAQPEPLDVLFPVIISVPEIELAGIMRLPVLTTARP